MPELPEVETIVIELNKQLIGHKILDVLSTSKKLRLPYTEDYQKRIINQKIQKVSRRAKYIILNLTNRELIIVHLGMSGRVLVEGCNKEGGSSNKKHNHIVLCLSGGKNLIFNDPRRFGSFTVAKRSDSITELEKLGVEPLSEEFNLDCLKKFLVSKKCNIKTFLMNSNIVVGIGNIYACEILFASRISPFRLANSITHQEALDILTYTKKILRKAINLKGSTLKDYRTSYGNSGGFQNFFQVYGRKGEECHECNTQITREVISGRSTFYCTKCQSWRQPPKRGKDK